MRVVHRQAGALPVKPANCLWRRNHRRVHTRCFEPAPTVTPAQCGEPAHHAVAGKFTPFNALSHAPGAHRTVTRKGPSIAGFLVTYQYKRADLRLQRLQRGQHVGTQAAQLAAVLRYPAVQIMQALLGKACMLRGQVGLQPKFRLVNPQWQHHGAVCARPQSGTGQRRVVMPA